MVLQLTLSILTVNLPLSFNAHEHHPTYVGFIVCGNLHISIYEIERHHFGRLVVIVFRYYFLQNKNVSIRKIKLSPLPGAKPCLKLNMASLKPKGEG